MEKLKEDLTFALRWQDAPAGTVQRLGHTINDYYIQLQQWHEAQKTTPTEDGNDLDKFRKAVAEPEKDE
jgi:hypothetical protein